MITFFISPLLFYLPMILNDKGCHKHNQQMHVCLHRYLEKDFTVIEDMIKLDSKRIILDPLELNEICSEWQKLTKCYEYFLQECQTFPEYRHLSRIINSFNGLNHLLCLNDTYGLKEVIYNANCVYRTYNQICHASVPLNTLFPQMIRFERGISACKILRDYRNCLELESIDSNCDQMYWKLIISRWIETWCLENQYSSSYHFLLSSLASSSLSSITSTVIPLFSFIILLMIKTR